MDNSELDHNCHSPWISATKFYGSEFLGLRLIRHRDDETSYILYMFGRGFILWDT